MNRLLALIAASLVSLVLTSPLRAQAPWPAEAPESWGLAIVDVETTGLEPGEHELVDLGAIYTDVHGNELGRFFVRVMPDHPERAGEIARSINGFSEERWQSLGAISQAEAAAQFLAFHEQMSTERRFVFTAYNASFDRGFVDAWLNAHGSDFEALYTYFALDLPSVAWGAGAIDLVNADVAAAYGVEAETSDPMLHTGLSGAEWNLELYRAMLAAGHGPAAQNR
ncbi:exonuclease domain-containing protein [Oceanicaulis sp. LC35]|uniref:3'-5' exonuclease n=1 Tax=Oceanicaulis sp. LC35 TaxID=3349635 RepID=UPI003F871634